MKLRYILRVMRLLVLFLLAGLMHVSATTYSQITLSGANIPFTEALGAIRKQAGYAITADKALLRFAKPVSIDAANLPLDEFLRRILTDQPLEATIEEKTVVIRRKRTHVELDATRQLAGGSQQHGVTGTVTDEQGNPLEGVTVRVNGTSIATTTDSRGRYALSIPGSGNALTYTIVGFESVESAFRGQSTIDVSMKAAVSDLEEVVVVGYGTIRKSDLTGSVTSVSAADVNDRPINSIEQLLQGRAAGVQIINNSGAPGGGMTFSIRGVTSVSGSNQPLIVIDGYPIDSDNDIAKETVGNQSGYLSEQPESNVLAMINPADIANIEILKDASAVAIYGSRASNGVVLITTKRGQKGADRVNYAFRSDLSSLARKIDVLSTADYLSYANEAYLNSGRDSLFNQAAVNSHLKTNTVWQDLIYRNSLSQNHQLNVSGGRDRTRYAISGGYLNQEGIINNTHFNRGNFRVNLDQEINRKLSFGLSSGLTMSGEKAVLQSASRGETSWSAILGVLTSRPFDSPYTPDDEIDQSQLGNPLTLVERTDDQNRVTTVISSMFVDYKLTDDLVFKLNGGVNANYAHRDFYLPLGTALGNSMGGYAYRGQSSAFNYLTEYTLNYQKQLGEKHRISAIGGYTWQQWIRRNFGINASNFPNDNLSYHDLGSASNIGSPATRTSQWALASMVARINYSYDDRFLFTLTGRADGSTRLAPGNKWDMFPSLAVGWNVHNERFMAGLDQVSSLKLRGSYGISGNQVIAVGSTRSRLSSLTSVVNQSIQIGYQLANLPNQTLRWERTTQWNAGLDMELFQNRVSLTIEYYRKVTQDLLMAQTIPPVNGFTSYNTNLGSVENRGFELALSAKVLTGKLAWDVSGDFFFNRNKIIDLGGASSFLGPQLLAISNQALHIAQPGYPIGSFYGYRITGIYQNEHEVAQGPADASSNPEPGSFKYADISGPDGVPDGEVNAFDRQVIGNPYPDFIAGLTNNLKWKRFGASVLVYASIGQDVINGNRHYLDALAGGTTSNVSSSAYTQRWVGEGTSHVYPKATATASRFHDRFTDFIVEDASFVRLKNVNVSYTLPVNNMLIREVRILLSAENLFTFTRYTGYDPEINSKGRHPMMPGIDFGSIPQYRTYAFGVNLRL